MLNIEKRIVGALSANCYAVYCNETREGIIIDPGANLRKITEMIDELEIKLTAVVLTHCHFDHALHADDIRKQYNVPIIIYKDENRLLESDLHNLSASFMSRPFEFSADKLVSDGDEIEIGNSKLTVIHTPGHTEGSMSLYGEGILISGDTLCEGTHGRTDFSTGCEEELAHSIEKLFELPDVTVVYSGHGRKTTIGDEKKMNYMANMLIERYK